MAFKALSRWHHTSNRRAPGLLPPGKATTPTYRSPCYAALNIKRQEYFIQKSFTDINDATFLSGNIHTFLIYRAGTLSY